MLRLCTCQADIAYDDATAVCLAAEGHHLIFLGDVDTEHNGWECIFLIWFIEFIWVRSILLAVDVHLERG